MTDNRIFVCKKSYGKSNYRLFYFPHAGGGPASFRDWGVFFSENIAVCSLQLPGREGRFSEIPYQNLDVLIQYVSSEISLFQDESFIFFGHSFGALICFELTRILRKKKLALPVHIFVSGSPAPQLYEDFFSSTQPISELSDEKLFLELEKISNSAVEILKDKEAISIFLPTLRADYRMCETYKYRIEEPFKMPITALGGKSDHINEILISMWRSQTTGRFSYEMLDGDHFFLNNHRHYISQLIESAFIMN